MSVCGSKWNAAVVVESPSVVGLQVPSNVLSSVADGVQSKTSVLAMFFNVKDGPVSPLMDVDPGAISYWRCHFSSCHDWYLPELSAHESASARAGPPLVVIVTPVPASIQLSLPSVAVVQFMSSFTDPVARASEL